MPKHPSWIKVHVPTPAQTRGMSEMRALLAHLRLETVCQGAQCPNAVECWSARTATFMILGAVCTRHCRFCDVPSGKSGAALDAGEPERLALAVQSLGLSHVVITSVDRDDLLDGGAAAFARTLTTLRASDGSATIEALLPDFQGNRDALDHILQAPCDVLGHNLETVRRLSPDLRDRRASYEQSLGVLRILATQSDGAHVKSGLMLGLGEATDEICTAMDDLRAAGVRILTLGQYLQPSPRAVPVARYVPPEEFDELAERARALGFSAVVAGPLVRSSYHAASAHQDV